MKRLWAVLLATTLLGCTLMSAAFSWVSFSYAIEVRPVDEAKNDPSFLSFREEFLNAIERRDIDFVVDQAAPDVRLSFGGASGRETFRKFLTLDDADPGGYDCPKSYWENLEEVLRMGGRFTEEGRFFKAPYTSTEDPGGDPFVTYFVIRDDAPLRDRPSRFGRKKAQLSYDVVEVINWGLNTSFAKVRLDTGDEGYVHKDHLRNAVDYRAGFEKDNGTWQMGWFLRGD